MKKSIHKLTGRFKGPNGLSLAVVWGSLILMVLVFFLSQRWIKSKVIDSDVISYYSYLPATFVHQDISMEYSLGDNYYSDKVWGVIWKDGFGPVQKYTMGMSVMYLPWFLGGHGVAHLVGAKADGYSLPYYFFMQISGVFYLFLGLFFLRKVLLRYFSDRVTALTLILLLLGSNLFYYTMGQAAMPHVSLFFLVSLLMHLTIRFYESPSWRHALLLGLIGSLITLIRPNHLLLWLLPLLYGVYNGTTLLARIHFIKQHILYFLSWAVVGFLVISPQLLYWHYLTDRWVYYSYGEEGFFFSRPQVWRVFFSFRNGWLIYSPLMALGLLGLLGLRRYAHDWTLPVLLTFAVAVYIISSWWCWWYGGSFGQRVLIDFYPMLALGMGAVLTWLAKMVQKKQVRLALLGVGAMFVMLNLFQTLQYTRCIIHFDSMTAAAYRASFGHLGIPDGYDKLLQTPDYEAALKGIYE